MTTHPDIRALVEAHVAAELTHDAEAAASFYAEDGWYDNVGVGVRHEGREAVAAQYASSYAGIPDLAFTIEGSVAEGDTLVHWGRFTGHAGGQQVSVPFWARFEARDGQIVGESLLYDVATLCEQTGIDVPTFRKLSGVG
jgi:uncharacterized protein (TIGR02246 family)